MHIDDDERAERDLLKLLEPTAYQSDGLEELGRNLLMESFDTLEALGVTSFFKVVCPVDLATVENALTRVFQDPVGTWSDLVVEDRVVEDHAH